MTAHARNEPPDRPDRHSDRRPTRKRRRRLVVPDPPPASDLWARSDLRRREARSHTDDLLASTDVLTVHDAALLRAVLVDHIPMRELAALARTRPAPSAETSTPSSNASARPSSASSEPTATPGPISAATSPAPSSSTDTPSAASRRTSASPSTPSAATSSPSPPCAKPPATSSPNSPHPNSPPPTQAPTEIPTEIPAEITMREITTAARVSNTVASLCATFGLSIRQPTPHPTAGPANPTTPEPRIHRAARELARHLRAAPSLLVLISGPSGGGKSSLLRALPDASLIPVSAARTPLRGDTAIIDRVSPDLATASEFLARAGLADAAAMIRPPRELSEGQRHRYAIAHAFAQTPANAIVLIDEFCSTLDRLTALGVCRSLRRWVAASPRRVVCATAHDDVLEWLTPDLAVHVPLAGPVEFRRSN